MAETTIMNVAGTFSVGLDAQAQWICRDDNDHYWSVVRDTTGNLRVYKSINSGATWLLKKTVTNADFSGGNPLPTDKFQLVNCTGQNMIYLRIVGLTNKYLNYSWKFNVTADTNQKGMDAVKMTVSYSDVNTYGCMAWDAANSRLLVIAYTPSPGTDTNYGEINLSTNTISNTSSVGGGDGVQRYAYYINPTDGYGYEVFALGNGIVYLHKKKNGASDYGNNLLTFNANWGSPITWLNMGVITDSNGDPIFYALYYHSSYYRIRVQRHNKSDLSLHVDDNYVVGLILPEICNMTIDGNDNLYFLLTKGEDQEAYSIKYDWSTFAETKISSDNDGQLVVPEIRVPATSTTLLLTYQATA